jgi:Protein of unknown function (DUF3667)
MKLNRRLRHNYDFCQNCENPLAENDNFCSNCSQKRSTGRIAFSQLVVQFFEDTVNWDARLFRSIRDLCVPGKLTIEYFKGRHVPYWQPLRLFLFMAALQMIIVNSSFNKATTAMQKANDETKRGVYEYLLLQKLDSLKVEVVKRSSSKKVAKAAMDSLLVYYVHPERLTYKISDKALLAKEDSLRKFLFAEAAKDGEIDSVEIEDNIKDFSEKLAEGIKTNNFSINLIGNMASDSIEIPLIVAGKNGVGINVEVNPVDKRNKASLSILKTDFINLTPDEILEKYQVTGFTNQLMIKQTIKGMKDGKSGIEFFLSRLSWMLILMMPVFAFFLELMNRPYYYVEHVIFSFHCHSFMFFLISSLSFLSNNILPAGLMDFKGGVAGVVSIALLVYFYKAMRNVYKQGRLKTILKFSFLVFSYFFTILFALIATLLVSFVFF